MRKKVLLCWGYHRIGWIEPFIKMSGEFDFEYLAYISPAEDPVASFSFPRHYWSDFRNAREVLDKIRPDKIIFMGLEGAYSAALNIVAKSRGITTYVAHHGVYHDYAMYVEQEKTSKNQESQNTAPGPPSTAKSAARFIVSSLLPTRPLAAFRLLRFMMAKRQSLQKALKDLHFSGMEPSWYIAFTHFNHRVYYQREGISKKHVLTTGNYYLDDFFKPASAAPPARPYYLLIDQPMAGTRYYKTDVSHETIIDFYQKLQRFAAAQGADLMVKLHPESYHETFFQHLEGITFLKDADVVALITQASGCFGTISNLMIPALYLKPCCLFDYYQSTTFDAFRESKLAQILPFRTFASEDILMNNYHKSKESLDTFTEQFLYRADGRSIERLSRILAAAPEHHASLS